MSTSEQRQGWTEERVALLEKLYADGLSSSQIAGRLRGVTRNAVIGKVHRLRLPCRATADIKRIKRTLPLRPTRMADINPWAGNRAANMNRTKDTRPPASPAPLPKESAVVHLPQPPHSAGVPVSLLDLEAHSCRYALTDDMPHLFCGDERVVNSSYCGVHHAACHTGVTVHRIRPRPLPLIEVAA